MEEDPNENELEERMYGMLHYADDTQENVNDKEYVTNIIKNTPRSTVRRYWRTSGEYEVNPYKKTNTSKESLPDIKVSNTVSKEDETHDAPVPKSADVIASKSLVTKNTKQTINVLNTDENIVELVTSDEDEVIEIALPPKPTITIDSSDDEGNLAQAKKSQLMKGNLCKQIEMKTPPKVNREALTASPVPSVVSSVSDEFIRGDCIALNISSRHSENQTFDFSLYGSDFTEANNSDHKKKRKRNKDVTTSTPIATEISMDKSTPKAGDGYFATPKSKAKNNKHKTKSYRVTDKSVPNADVYDSDSNQSVVDKNEKLHPNENLPNADSYESDSSQFETIKDSTKSVQAQVHVNYVDSSDSSVSSDKETNNLAGQQVICAQPVIDLTGDKEVVADCIAENIVMGNVSGFIDVRASGHKKNKRLRSQNEISNFVSTKIPAILKEDLDFDNLKGKDNVCRSRQYSLTTLRAEMDEFYNESWGGENFNHEAILANMPSDAKLWAIDSKDRAPPSYRKKACAYCNRHGHREDTCRMKPPVCYMCGSNGHIQTRCPRKICVNCGSPNSIYSAICRNCSNWRHLVCMECGQMGHPSSHCPDLWRRYHNTIDDNTPLQENRHIKSKHQLYCSGCAHRGHLVHTCRQYIPFTSHAINSPYVSVYRPIYFAANSETSTFYNPTNNEMERENQKLNMTVPLSQSYKRQSTPTWGESHCNKKRNVSMSDVTIENQPFSNNKSGFDQQKKNLQTDKWFKDTDGVTLDLPQSSQTLSPVSNRNLNSNRDRKGHVIQDNEVSDTSDVITSAKIFITKDIAEHLKTKEGEEWLSEAMRKHNVSMQKGDLNMFLSITGKNGDQEAFQLHFREWAKSKKLFEHISNDRGDNALESTVQFTSCIPKKKHQTLLKLNKAFRSLNKDLGDPSAIYEELTYLRDKKEKLLKAKDICPKKLNHNKINMNRVLKRLNMLLIGQAGLADGMLHLNELHSLQKRIAETKAEIITPDLRKAIEDHYYIIFTSAPRGDYEELLNKYYTSRQTIMFTDTTGHNMTPIKSMKKKKFFPQNKQNNYYTMNNKSNDHILLNTRKAFAGTKEKLVSYHKSILRVQPIDTVMKKTRLELARQLRKSIKLSDRYVNMSPKALKRMRKIQYQAELFLTNNL